MVSSALPLTVCTVNFDSWKYIRFLDHTMRRLATDLKFRWLICDVTPGHSQEDELSRLQNVIIVRHDLGGLKGSQAHGAALNRIISLVDTEYSLVVDPDCAFLSKGWDLLCLEALNEKTIMIGAPYHPSAWFRYQNFPSAVCMFYRTKPFLELAIDLSPEPFWLRKIKARFRWIPGVGDRDVGWRLPVEFRRAGYEAKSFAHLKWDEPDTVVLSRDTPGSEFHWQGIPVLTHLRHGSSLAFDEDRFSVKWLDAICAHIGLDREEVHAIVRPTY